MIFGQPDQWLALLIESLLRRRAAASTSDRSELRARAFDEAPASTGDIDGRPFEWIADADSRLGPVLEAVINGRYYWVPFSRLTKIADRGAGDLRDVVWMPAHLQFENGGESVALIPTRYPGSETAGGRPDRAGAQDRLGRGRPDIAPRPRSAHPRDRRRRRAAAWRSARSR